MRVWRHTYRFKYKDRVCEVTNGYPIQDSLLYSRGQTLQQFADSTIRDWTVRHAPAASNSKIFDYDSLIAVVPDSIARDVPEAEVEVKVHFFDRDSTRVKEVMHIKELIQRHPTESTIFLSTQLYWWEKPDRPEMPSNSDLQFLWPQAGPEMMNVHSFRIISRGTATPKP